MKLVLVPAGWPVKLIDCRPGLFVFNECVGFKTEYKDEQGYIEVYNQSGEVFVGGEVTKKERGNLIVQPVDPKWQKEEE